MGIMTDPLRCYRCGTRFTGVRCPECNHAADFHDMDMRLGDCARLLCTLVSTGLRRGRHRGNPRSPLRTKHVPARRPGETLGGKILKPA